MSGRRSRRWSLLSVAIAALVVVTLVSGMVGYLDRDVTEKLGDGMQSKHFHGQFLDAVYLSLLLLWMGGKSTYDNTWLMIGRWSGALFAFTSLLKLLAPRLEGAVQRLRIRALRGHTIVIGLGQKGLSFVRDAAHKTPVVTLDTETRDSDDLGTDDERANRRGVFFLRGDASKGEALEDVGLARAATVVVATTDDVTNLSIARRLGTHSTKRRVPTALDVLVHVGDSTLRAHGLAGMPHRDHVNIHQFSLAALAAHRLYVTWPLDGLAALQGADSVHLVFIGFDEFSEAILLQTACRVGSLDPARRPRVSVFTADPAALERRLDHNFPALKTWVPVRTFRAFDPRVDLTDDDLASVEGPRREHPVTAIIVTDRTDTEAFVSALRVRARTEQETRWLAPVFVRLQSSEEFASALSPLSRVKWLSRAVEPFGGVAQLCSAEGLRAWDLRARKVHAAWKATFGQEGSPAAKSWGALAEEYRQSNRRAVDHFNVKLATLGYIVRGDTPNLGAGLVCDDRALARLAALEHESWQAERQLAGWTKGPRRDDVRRQHADLAPEAPSDPRGRKDVTQILAIAKACSLPDEPVTCFLERRIALVGDTDRPPSAAVLTERLARLFEALGVVELLGKGGNELWTFVTPLTSPAAHALATAVSEVMRPYPSRHRFVVLRDEASEAATGPSSLSVAERDAFVASRAELVVEISERRDASRDAVAHLAAAPVVRYLLRTCDHALVVGATTSSSTQAAPTLVDELLRAWPKRAALRDAPWCPGSFPVDVVELDGDGVPEVAGP